MKKFNPSRILCVILVLMLMLSACVQPHEEVPPQSLPTAAPSPTPAPTENPAIAANKKLLDELDWDMFLAASAADAFSLKLSITDPTAYGIPHPKSTWGDISYAAELEYHEETKANLLRLNNIDRNLLSDDDKLTYDTIAQHLNAALESIDYYYYASLLSPYSGLHSNLPFNLMFYQLDNAVDCEDYIALLEDVPRLFDELIVWEQEKSERGLFMSDATLDDILTQITDFINSKEECYLYGLFASSSAEVELTAEERAAFEARSTAAIDEMFVAYQELHDALSALRGTGMTGSYASLGEEGKAYYAYGLRNAASSLITPDEAFDLLYKEAKLQYERFFDAAENSPHMTKVLDTITLRIGTPEEDMQYLLELMEGYYPAVPDHEIEILSVPDELASQLAPAAYLIPPVDRIDRNLVLMNYATLDEASTLMTTLAHEGYPGHLYHYNYIRTLRERTGWFRQSMGLTAYYEGWSQSSEDFFNTHTEEFSNDYCIMMAANSQISSLYIPALISIGVHWKNWGEAEVAALIGEFFGAETGAESAGYYIQVSLGDPFYFLEYALGLAQQQDIIRKARLELLLDFDFAEFNEAYLNIGPTFFNFIEEKVMDWAKSK